MGKLCIVMNMAPHYVQESYSLFDRHFDLTWCFGENRSDIKGMDLSLLKDVRVFPVRTFRRFYSLAGACRLACDRDISTYIILAELHFLTAWTLPRRIRRHNPAAKVFFWAHGWYGTESRAIAWLKKRLFAPSDGILLYGNYARELMIREGFDASRLHVIHNSLAHSVQVRIRERMRPSAVYQNHFDNRFANLIVIGRLTERKRIPLLFDAMCLLRDRGLDINVTLVGDGPERQHLEKQVATFSLGDRVWFHGACYDEETNAELIYNADICVIPGDVGLTAIHTLTFGTPCITHDDFRHQGPEFESVVPGLTGLFFKHEDAGSLADCIAFWLDGHPDREAVRSACFSEIDQNWTPEFELNVLQKVVS